MKKKILINVEPTYLEEHSDPFEDSYLWAGVVGEQPVLEPGEEFEYTSGTPLKTTSGMMHGSYLMQNFECEEFEVNIPPFSLDIPDRNKTLN